MSHERSKPAEVPAADTQQVTFPRLAWRIEAETDASRIRHALNPPAGPQPIPLKDLL